MRLSKKKLEGCSIGWAWHDGKDSPAVCFVADPCGEPLFRVDCSGLIDEIERRQARGICRQVEDSDQAGPELGALLAMAPSGWELRLVQDGEEWFARWSHPNGWRHIGRDKDRVTAMITATRLLLGLEPAGG